MQKTIWYGANNTGQVQFAENASNLATAGVNNPQSFTVNGEVTGLHLIGNTNEQDVGAKSSSSQTA